MGRVEVKSRVLVIRAFEGLFDYAPRVRRLGSVLLLGFAACASSVPRSVPRVVEGRVESGPAVAPYAYRWFIEGEMLASRGQHDEAAMAFEAAATATSRDVLLLTRLAEEYEISGASRRADRTLAYARRYDPHSARISLTEGRILARRGEVDRAFRAFARARRLAPSASDPVVATANLLLERGHPRRAAAALLEYLETAPPDRAGGALAKLFELAHRTGAPETLVRALALDLGSNPSEQARAAARMAVSSGRPSLAARLLEASLDSRENVELWLHALAQSGQRERAVEFLSSPSAARWLTVDERADSLVGLDRAARVLDLLAAADRSPRVQISRGEALLAQGRYSRAVSVLAEVPLGSSTYERSRIALAVCSTAQRRTGVAAETLSVTPHQSLRVRRALAEIYVEEGELRAALRLFDPRRLAERTVVASLFERAGRYREAAAYYATLKVSGSIHPRLRARISAEQLVSRGLHSSAIAILEHWASASPDDFYERVRLVELLRAVERFDEARARGQEVVNLITDPRLRTHLAGLLREAAPAGP